MNPPALPLKVADNLQERMRPASLLQFFWVAVRSVAVTLSSSCVALSLSLRKRNQRPAVDALIRRWSQRLINIIGLQYRVFGNVPDFNDGRRYIIMCSHASHYDIPLSFIALPGSIRMLAKKELSRIPIFGAAMTASEFIFIDRHNREHARKDLMAARKKMESGIVLWVAPEGTRSIDGRLLPFKKGCFHLAIETQAVIIPVAIRDIINVLPKGSWSMNLGVNVGFHIGEPIDASAYTLDRRAELTALVEMSMRKLLDQAA